MAHLPPLCFITCHPDSSNPVLSSYRTVFKVLKEKYGNGDVGEGKHTCKRLCPKRWRSETRAPAPRWASSELGSQTAVRRPGAGPDAVPVMSHGPHEPIKGHLLLLHLLTGT